MSEYIVRITDDMPYEIKAELNAWYIESEPIVRCRDCFHYEDGENNYGVPRQCLASGYLLDNGDGYCAWGERRG